MLWDIHQWRHVNNGGVLTSMGNLSTDMNRTIVDQAGASIINTGTIDSADKLFRSKFLQES